MAQIIVDANATLGLFLRLPYSEKIDARMKEWQAMDASISVPLLWEYECITGLRRAASAKLISLRERDHILEGLMDLQFHRVLPTLELHRSALLWAERIGQSKVYDAHYLAAAESIGAEFWTADERLVHKTQELHLDWVFLI